MALESRADRQRSERGVTTVEYSLVLAGVAVLVVAAFVTFPNAMSQLYDQVFCQLGGSCQPHAGRGGPSIDPWDSSDPLIRAKWGNMVVLGDSYSSGEGGDDYGVTGSTPGCHASANAYGPAVAKSLGMSDRLTVTACTGASLSDLAKRYSDHDQPPQLGTVDDHTSLVTMTLGANDLDWPSVLKQCGELHTEATVAMSTPHLPGLPAVFAPAPSCASAMRADVGQRISALKPRLDSAYATLKQGAPNARIVVMGYPHPFPSTPTTDVRMAFAVVADPADQRWMNSKLDEVNQEIKDAAKANGVEYVDTTNALAGHELTTANTWIFPLDRQNWHSISPAQHDFHPTPAGQAAMAKLAERQINHP
jgi:lysophospholipase L1-like esterase/Flp pilus assembly pilin Flp